MANRTIPKPPARTADPLLTVPEVMAELRVGRNKVYDLFKSGLLRSFTIGTGANAPRRIRRSALDEYIAAQERAS